MEHLLTSEGLVALLTLSAMEIVLGIDNIIFIAILVAKLPQSQQARARQIGIGMALITRLALLFSITWVMGLTKPVVTVLSKGFSGRDLILLCGGLFLIAKATFEIHEKLESGPDQATFGTNPRKRGGFATVIFQIMVLDLVFSLDSVITAVGMAQQISIMVVAMLIAVAVMLFSAGPISSFVHKHPTLKILALSFLLLIGVMLLMEGMGKHVDKGYIYFAMAFSLLVELLNMRFRKVVKPVELKEPPSA